MKKFKLFLLSLILLPICLLCTGCFAGESAYDIAVRHGYTGTEAQWLASLKGLDGEDGEDGDTPDVQIIDGIWYINGLSTGITAEGQDGAYAGQGKSAYEIAVENGFVGTEEEWLASLKGDKGDTSDSVVTDVVNSTIMSVVAIESKFTVLDMFSRPEVDYGYGSGVIVEGNKTTGEAYIITNHHVIYEKTAITTDKYADSVNVYLYGYEYTSYAIPAQIVGASQTYDIAVLKITSDLYKTSIAKPAEFAESKYVTAGDEAIVIGNGEGEGIAATSGIISLDCEYITMTATLADGSTQNITYRSLRTDAAVNPGNSGGPMFDKNGKIIGIINIKTTSEDIDNMAYAIPSDIASKVYTNILTNQSSKKVKKVTTGLAYAISSSSSYYDSTMDRIRINEVVKVKSIEATSAAVGKLQVGDTINSIKIGSKTYSITRAFEPVDLELIMSAGGQVTYNITRGAVTTNVVVTYNTVEEVI